MPAVEADSQRAALGRRFRAVRAATEALCEPLAVEDMVAQSMPDASPAKWHLGHTTWFFETFILDELTAYEPPNPLYRHIFNSYYQAVGSMHPRPLRGLLTRPTVAEVRDYRRRVDDQLVAVIDGTAGGDWPEIARRLEIGLHHEQQHQELLLMDVQHLFAQSPLDPCYAAAEPPAPGVERPLAWHGYPGGTIELGHGGGGFAFDNELPRHRVLLEEYELASRLVTAGEWLDFIADGGYETPSLWLSDGWARVCEEGWRAPLYWRRAGEAWHCHTLRGVHPVNRATPIVHVSYFEADAFARWAGARLPTEAEWERAAAPRPVRGNFVESGALHPQPAPPPGDGPAQLYGDVWELTTSPYTPYPGYRSAAGALGEYNGKFMSGQQVLRGGACVTPASHARATYRNFFYPHQRWAFSGLRLARDA